MVGWLDVGVAHRDRDAGVSKRVTDIRQVSAGHARPTREGVAQIVEAEIL